MDVTGYTPEDLVETAEALLDRSGTTARGVWPRAAAHLCRQALESALDVFWSARLPGMESVSRRAQLACLPTYLPAENGALARRVAYAWHGLSEACHHRVYELAPTASELSSWVATVTALLDATRSEGS